MCVNKNTATFIEDNDIHHRWVYPQPLMIRAAEIIPWPVAPAHAFTRVRVYL